MNKEHTTLPFTRWKEKVKESDRTYKRQQNQQQLEEELNTLADDPEVPPAPRMEKPDADL